jgi:ribonuclease VapC
MIVLDTSALVAVLWNEPEADSFTERMAQESTLLLSAPSRLEAFVVCRRRRDLANAARMENLIAGLGVVTVPFDEVQLIAARDAYATYGTGRFGLNFGDCFAYALAKTRGLPLLFKGDDFRATDVEPAL